MPAIARPRRPLSIRASHASWSIRFSLRMMISGAPSSRSRLRRLLRLITRRYRSLRSDVANRPPSSCTIGRRSGGMTGRTERIIHSGRLPERRNASIRRRRLIAFLRRWPELVRTSACSWRDSSSRSMRTMMSRTASAPMPAQKMRPVLAPEPYFSSSWRSSISPIVMSGLSDSISARACLSSSFWPWASDASVSRSPRSVSSMAATRSWTFCSVRRSSSASRVLSSSVTRSVSAATILRSFAVASLPPLSPAATTTSPVGANAMVSSAAPVPSALRAASIPWASRTSSSVRVVRWASSSPLVVASVARSSSRWRLTSAFSWPSSSATRWPPAPPRPSDCSSSAFRARWRASSSTWVTMYSAK